MDGVSVYFCTLRTAAEGEGGLLFGVLLLVVRFESSVKC